MQRIAQPDERGEVLVAIVNQPRDLTILREQLWYRVPVSSCPKRWPLYPSSFTGTVLRIPRLHPFAGGYYG